MIYNWQQKDWPDFAYETSKIEDRLNDFIRKSGRISGLVEGLTQVERDETLVEVMVNEAIKTSEIEGEYLSRQDVMSSIKRNLGFDGGQKQPRDQRAVGAAALMTAVRDQFNDPLTEKMLFEWHRLIMMGSKGIEAGQWTTHAEPMQVVSGAVGKEKVHYEAPPSDRVPREMKKFIKWYNETAPGKSKEIKHAAVRSAVAHLYFETIHPFEDGNGRIGRAISEKAISQGLGQPTLISISKTIEADKNAYYEALKKAQRSNRITPWVAYFVQVIVDAQTESEALIDFTLKTTRFFDQHKSHLNDRQQKIIRRMLDEGPKGFEGGMTAKKYMAIAKTTKATATRDLQDLVEQGAFFVEGGGRSTRYDLNLR